MVLVHITYLVWFLSRFHSTLLMANPSTVNARSIFMSLTPVAFNLFSLCYAVVTGKRKKKTISAASYRSEIKEKERARTDRYT